MTPDNNNENSRMEDILTGMLNNTPSSELPEAHSRVEELLLQVLDKMNAGGGGGSGGGAVMVEITNPDGGSCEFRMNKTVAEIYEAFTAGMTLVCHFEDNDETKDAYGMITCCNATYYEGVLSFYTIYVVDKYGSGVAYTANSSNDYPRVYND